MKIIKIKTMKKSILKTIAAGIILGAGIFYLPFFLLRVLLVFVIISTFFRYFIGRRFGRRFNPAFTDRIRSMNEEEYKSFKEKFNNSCKEQSAKKNFYTNSLLIL
jgi:membrane protein DedA with SNARE-associated domain